MESFKAFRIWLIAFTACIIAQAVDIVSSLGFKVESGWIESNPLTRHANGAFWLYHGIVLKLFLLGYMSALSFILYVILARINKKLAIAVAIIPLLIQAYLGLDAGMRNITFHSGWYVDIPEER